MRVSFLAWITSIVSFCGAVEAATVTDTGFGFVHIITARDGSGSNSSSQDDGTAIALNESVEGILSTNGGPNSATVTGNLATGEIGAVTVDADGNVPTFNASAKVQMVDTLFIDLTAFGSSFTDDITFGFDVDGSYFTDGSGLQNGANAFTSFYASNGGSTLKTTYRYAGDGAAGVLSTAASPEAWDAIGTIGTVTTIESDMFRGLFTLSGGVVNAIDIEFAFDIDGNADFGSTGTFFIDSPYEFTSASGVFLSEQNTPPDGVVPVPLPALLLLTGLGSIFIVRRRA
jgi:hypothetical protein